VSLHYAIEARVGLAAPRADLDDCRLRIAVPDGAVRRWITSDEPGFEVQQPNGSAEPLHLVVEKDFACLHREDESADAFPNPAVAAR
jgi:hypothetical protein